jgi:predicted acylesterase/phospholipase RssA
MNSGLRSLPHEQGKVALVLAGGGITGAVYEVGALLAINDLLVGRTVNDFEIYVGTSGGALVAALIANGVTPPEIMQIIERSHPEIRNLRVGDLFDLNPTHFLQRLRRLPGSIYRAGRNLVSQGREAALTDILWELAEVLPSGLYSTAALERYLCELLTRPGRTNDFRALAKELYIVATDLDSGRRAVFSRNDQGTAPISRAVAASSAVPVLYRPVQIGERDYVDGGLQGAASLDLAIEAGAELVVCINPMAPLDAVQAHANRHYIRDHGFQAVFNQSVRTLLHAGVRYHVKNLRAKYPRVDIILIEPQWDDQAMFGYNPMHYRSRQAVAAHGFRSVTAGLMSNPELLRRVLSRHGIELRAGSVPALPIAIDPDHAPAGNDAPTNAPPLAAALAELEGLLGRLKQQPSVQQL